MIFLSVLHLQECKLITANTPPQSVVGAIPLWSMAWISNYLCHYSFSNYPSYSSDNINAGE
nr:MAG TPA_asm: hypothetical protein [Caudoviricetes sp.]